MRRRAVMILASALLAGSILATGAQAQGGGNFGRGMGGFGGGDVGGLGFGPIGGHVDELGAGARAHFDQGHPGIGRRHFVNGRIYDYDLGCPYDTSNTAPNICTY